MTNVCYALEIELGLNRLQNRLKTSRSHSASKIRTLLKRSVNRNRRHLKKLSKDNFHEIAQEYVRLAPVGLPNQSISV